MARSSPTITVINMAKLSVNINKVALIRNSRGGNLPDVIKFAMDCEKYGAEGITVHPRPDERHIRFKDVYQLKECVKTELNIEGNPTEKFTEMVLDVVPDQVTLVPDDPNQLTSDHGWDTVKHESFLQDVIKRFREKGIRTSIFLDPDPDMIESAVKTGTDRIELYTESFAANYHKDNESAIEDYLATAIKANEFDLGINAGHDLNLDNLNYFAKQIPGLLEVSIGHALISDALYFGIENTIQLYLRALKNI